MIWNLDLVSPPELSETIYFDSQLGAAEFLQKPVSEAKLKNIWQHVVHKVTSWESPLTFRFDHFSENFLNWGILGRPLMLAVLPSPTLLNLSKRPSLPCSTSIPMIMIMMLMAMMMMMDPRLWVIGFLLRPHQSWSNLGDRRCQIRRRSAAPEPNPSTKPVTIPPPEKMKMLRKRLLNHMILTKSVRHFVAARTGPR